MVTCTPDGNIAEIIAVNPVTGDQTTRFLYGTTLGSGGAGESAIARSDLLVAILGSSAESGGRFRRCGARRLDFRRHGRANEWG